MLWLVSSAHQAITRNTHIQRFANTFIATGPCTEAAHATSTSATMGLVIIYDGRAISINEIASARERMASVPCVLE